MDAIRLLALEEILLELNPATVRFVSANRALQESIGDLCRNLDIAYEWDQVSQQGHGESRLRRIYRALPERGKAVASLARYLVGRWPFRRGERTGWVGGGQSLFVCTYFFFVSSEPAAQGRYECRYWDGLKELAIKLGWSVNWLQLYIPHEAVPNPRVALGWAGRFNQRRGTEGFHAFIDGYLTWNVVLRAVMRWGRLCRDSTRLNGIEIERAFRPRGSHVSLWPLLSGDWRASMRGTTAIENMLWIELFDSALAAIPRQELGLILCENHAWERAFIDAWRKHGHGRLIAVQHATVRFWDLRYFSDSRTLRSVAPRRIPEADLTALNGTAAVDAYLSVCHPEETIVESEALRYGYLDNLRHQRGQRGATGGPLRVLILGDYKLSGTVAMLRLLEAAAPLMARPAIYSVKPHPNANIDPANYASLALSLVGGQLGELFQAFDIVYASNGTSAAADAYVVGLPIVVMLDERELNFSPLRGESRARFAGTPEELADALCSTGSIEAARPVSRDFFFVDSALPRWRRLLADCNAKTDEERQRCCSSDF